MLYFYFKVIIKQKSKFIDRFTEMFGFVSLQTRVWYKVNINLQI
jgi:hypothetical protein